MDIEQEIAQRIDKELIVRNRADRIEKEVGA